MVTSRQELLKRVQRVFEEVFLDDSGRITEETQLSDIPEWDSMVHVTLVMALEREFDVRFNAKDASQAVAIRPILDILTPKLEKSSR